MFKKILNHILPPFITVILSKIGHATGILSKTNKYIYEPKWHYIKGGYLKDRKIYVDPHDGYWQREIIEGNYDQFFFDYLKQLDLNGKTVFEIGAHIGYHAMNFAQLVGPRGKVFAFEPNQYNIERFNLILTKNGDLANRIKIFDLAISDKTGEVEFYFSRHVDDGRSTGSFIQGAHTPFTRNEYEKVGFKKQTVRAVSLDHISTNLGIKEVPALIKIDVEGAENLVLEGGKQTILKNKAVVLIEVHTIFNMLQICHFFNEINYGIKLLNESQDGRCFISAFPN